MTDHLFSPITLDSLTFPNRIAIPPMCQYSADDGSPGDWHLQQWMTYALSGAGMVTMEMTDVERRGRITHGCLGLYTDDNEAATKRTLDAARRVAQPGTRFGAQIAHAGRKASCQSPWEGGGPLQKGSDPWQTVSASAVPFADGWHTPHALEEDEILELIEKYAASAVRARRAGYDFLELHAAHGYLIHQFYSPVSNRRTDRWGGTLENRMRFAVETARAVRKAVPDIMLGARLSLTDWVEGGLPVEEGIEIARALADAGVAYICCSSGGNSPFQQIPTGAGYQVHLAEAVKKAVDVPVRAVGLITEPHQANAIVTEGKADIVALGRAILADPRWPWRAAAALGHDLAIAPQFARAHPTLKHWITG